MTSARLKHVFLFSIAVLSGAFTGNAQDTTDQDEALTEVQGLVSFYEYMLNTVGSARSTTRDKEVIITESYKKAFLNSEVQVEDDLLPDRNAITNKNIGAYLRDVDFFFQDISFRFEEVNITKAERENGEPYYLVDFRNTIEATNLEGMPYKSTSKRFLEVNVDKDQSDLKIVSVYTTKVSREKELRNWWESLSYGWMRVFKDYVSFDTISTEVLFEIADLDSISLRENQLIQDIGPLAALKNLRHLDISDTKVGDLSPLRGAMKLESLIASNTNLVDLGALQYFDGLRSLDLSQTYVRDIAPIGRLAKLEYLNLSGTNVVMFDPISSLKNLKEVDLSHTAFSETQLLANAGNLTKANLSRTGVSDLRPIGRLTGLRELDVSETYVNDLSAFAGHPSLEWLAINQTVVNSLEPLHDAPRLKKVYADYSGVGDSNASRLMSQKPGVVVVTNSQRVMDWWRDLPGDWKAVLTKVVGVANPDKEDVIRLLNTDSLNVSKQRLVSTAPLEKFTRLRYLDVSRNLFTDFSFTNGMMELEFLRAEKLACETTIGLEQNKNLKFVILSGGIIEDIRSLQSLNKLELVDLEQTAVPEEEIKVFLDVNPGTVVIYQSEALEEWWSGLPDEWQEIFDVETPDAYHLHKLIESQSIKIENSPVTTLRPLNAMINLTEVHLSNTGIYSLIDLVGHDKLERIVCKNGPLSDLESIERHPFLKYLDISNTAVSDLRPLAQCRALEDLNCSGTNIKKLKGITDLKNLSKLNISNTRVWQLDRLYDIRTLKSLVCYNTRIRSHKIEEFKGVFPDCQVTYY